MTSMTARVSGRKSGLRLALRLFVAGFVLMVVGVAIMFVAALLSGESNVSGGVVLIIWFIPVIVGWGPYSFSAVLIGVILSVIALAVFVWLRRKTVAADQVPLLFAGVFDSAPPAVAVASPLPYIM
jgi:uncharacterized membrane protein